MNTYTGHDIYRCYDKVFSNQAKTKPQKKISTFGDIKCQPKVDFCDNTSICTFASQVSLESASSAPQLRTSITLKQDRKEKQNRSKNNKN